MNGNRSQRLLGRWCEGRVTVLVLSCLVAAPLAVCSWVTVARADESGQQAQRDQAPSAESKSSAEGNRGPSAVGHHHETLVRATEVIGTDLAEVDDSLGSVADLVLDLQTSQAALALCAYRDPPQDAEAMLALPITAWAFDRANAIKKPWLTDEMIRQSSPVTPPFDRFDRRLAGEQYQQFDQPPYWLAFVDRQQAKDPNFEFDTRDFKLVLFSSLKDTAVVSSENDVVGTISDLAIDPISSQIAYAVMDTAKDRAKRFAIPLGAFVATDDQRFKIELGRDEILKRPTFRESNLPKVVDRGWIEYVAVRYGREGVQNRPHQPR
ncbi:PRC-barrel domain containing protein [Roseiconus nitratireducens]|uniref:PRC-barrel domain containing protein n=1 Tax=Roseiconus nitratireducens TaxID=2605748 RepID=A0A5M6DD05_9BACT|nr:PRC-barrel domain-containing protein [Roseiconus nitratireducens]KAA5545457.1 PRC-barrel domain containing protein [Roseiconus nitratireducens]